MNNFKKFSLVACFSTVVSLGSIAQTNTLPTSGGVGIGTTAPRSPFEVKLGAMSINMFHLTESGGTTLSWSNLGMGFNCVRQIKTIGNPNVYKIVRVNNGSDNGGSMIFTDPYGNMRFSTFPSSGASDVETTDDELKKNALFSLGSDGIVRVGKNFHFWEGAGINNNTAMEVNGKIRISSNTGSFGNTIVDNNVRLSVAGKIYAEGVKVSMANTWPDYVFKKDYKLNTLEEVEQYILTNSHLPDVPSEQEVKEKGIELGDMNAILLRKVEELTLYMIQLKKDNELLKAQLELITK